MNAIILAGGFGTRLKECVSNVPKPLAPINGIPFLKILLQSIQNLNIEKIILSVGYKSDIIIEQIGSTFSNIPIEYSIEKKPLQTGGAIKQSLMLSKSENNLILNGDSFTSFKFNEFYREHLLYNRDISIVLKYMEDTSRYGQVEFDSNLNITAFKEKKSGYSGWINCGVYLIKSSLIQKMNENVFSFEDFLGKNVNTISIGAFLTEGSFIDIGIPSDYRKAQGFEFK